MLGNRPVALVPRVVTSRNLEEGFDQETYRAAVSGLLPQIMALPNVAVVDRARLTDGAGVRQPGVHRRDGRVRVRCHRFRRRRRPPQHRHRAGRLFETQLAGCGSASITLWEADQSNSEWYDKLGIALRAASDMLGHIPDFADLLPTPALYGTPDRQWRWTFDGHSWSPVREMHEMKTIDSPALASFNDTLYCVHRRDQ